MLEKGNGSRNGTDLDACLKWPCSSDEITYYRDGFISDTTRHRMHGKDEEIIVQKDSRVRRLQGQQNIIVCMERLVINWRLAILHALMSLMRMIHRLAVLIAFGVIVMCSDFGTRLVEPTNPKISDRRIGDERWAATMMWKIGLT